MTAILTGRDKTLARWAAARIPHETFGTCHAIGLATGDGPDDELMAVVVYHGFNPKTQVCQISVASINPHWATRNTFRKILAVPFLDMGCNRVWAMVPQSQGRTLKLMSHAGFTREGDLKSHFGYRANAVCFRMLANEYERHYPAARKPRITAPAFIDLAERHMEAA